MAGFSRFETPVKVVARSVVSVAAPLEVSSLAETLNVVANSVTLDVSTLTQTTTFSGETPSELPTATRNYTHVIVAEAGVNAIRPAAGSPSPPIRARKRKIRRSRSTRA